MLWLFFQFKSSILRRSLLIKISSLSLASQVFTPASDPFEWQFAKAMVNLADSKFCQAYWHWSHIHFSSQVYCAIYQSHFSELHPLFQIMRYHCEGTTPHIALAWTTLGMNGQDRHTHFNDLALKARGEYKYGILAYDELLKVSIGMVLYLKN